jgi:hypothetical protein
MPNMEKDKMTTRAGRQAANDRAAVAAMFRGVQKSFGHKVARKMWRFYLDKMIKRPQETATASMSTR